MLVRQAHPGPGVPAYEAMDRKEREAQRYVSEEGIPWLVLVDDVAGTTHQAYGGLADPTYLIGTDGRVSFVNLVTHVPSLDRAVRRLLAQGGRGVVGRGWDRRPHVLAPMADGWRALRRGQPQSLVDLMLAAPGAPVLFRLGRWTRPILAPVALRDRPLPPAVRSALFAAASVGMALMLLRTAGRRATGGTS